MDNKSFAASLRQLADFYEAHEDFPQPVPELNIYSCDDPEKIGSWVRVMGNVEKDYSDQIVTISKNFNGIKLALKPYRETVCIKRVIGKKILKEKIPTDFIEEEKEVEIIEWDCRPLLARTESEGQVLAE